MQVTYTAETIGSVHTPCGGLDRYHLIKSEATLNEVKNQLIEDLCYSLGDGRFCHNIDVVRKPYSLNEFIAIVQHRRDV